MIRIKNGEQDVEGELSKQSFPPLGGGLGMDFAGDGFE